MQSLNVPIQAPIALCIIQVSDRNTPSDHPNTHRNVKHSKYRICVIAFEIN